MRAASSSLHKALLQLGHEEQQKAAAGDIKNEERKPQTDIAVERNERKIRCKIAAYGNKHGNANGLGIKCTVENAVVDDTQRTDKREKGDKQIIFLRSGDDVGQICKAAENAVAAGVIKNGLRQTKAYGPDKADTQRIIEHGPVVLAEGYAGVDCSCLRKAGEDIAHDELNLEQNGVRSQKLTAEG